MSTTWTANAGNIYWVWHSSGAPGEVKEIALLLDQLYFSGDLISIRHRMSRLIVKSDLLVTPVVHVQLDTSKMPALGSRHTLAIKKAVYDASVRSTSGWVQLDFEVVESQRDFYVDLIAELKRNLPKAIKLSVTVLASWCSEPGLLDRLHADEIVPMFFKMGAIKNIYWKRLFNHPELLDSHCRQQAIGFAVQEMPPLEVQQRYKRRYWFNSKNWDSLDQLHNLKNFSQGE